jgi:hypothetical protein
MADYFLDTSAVVKRYVQETGTAWIRTLAAPATGHFIYLARISEVEVTSALARRRGQPGLSVAQARGALGLFRQDFAQGLPDRRDYCAAVAEGRFSGRYACAAGLRCRAIGGGD